MSVLKKGIKYIGFYGYPDPDILNKYIIDPEYKLIDLDLDYGSAETGILPDAYCQIITNIVDNACAFKESMETVIASVGEEKCDQGRFAALILKDLGFTVISTRYNHYGGEYKPLKIAVSGLPLRTKVMNIMDSLIMDMPDPGSPCEPTHGFWGVPPHDLKILDLFPDTTHVFGWTRCVEAGKPADLNLETYVNPVIPTVFYAQTFCAKNQLAKYLADKYRGLYVDCDGPATTSLLAKIEAFIRMG